MFQDQIQNGMLHLGIILIFPVYDFFQFFPFARDVCTSLKSTNTVFCRMYPQFGIDVFSRLD